MTANASSKRSPLAFFVVLLALAMPIWAVSRFGWVIVALKIPVTDLMLGFTPLTAATILVFRAEGVGGLSRFLRNAFDYRTLVRSRWLATVLLLAPFIYGLTNGGLWLAGYRSDAARNIATLPMLTAIMFLLAIGEEAGWTGYVLDPLQERFGALGASFIIAIPWWVGHLPSIVEIGGSLSDIAWWLPGAIALRVLMTWLYNNTARSLLAVVLFHALLNVSRWLAYPTIGAHYTPIYQATGYAICFVLSAIVVVVWGPKTLTRPPSK